MTTSNGSNLAVLYAFTITLIICANIQYGMFAWTAGWAIYAYRRVSKPRNDGAELTTGERRSD